MQPPAYQYPQQPAAAVVYPPQPGQTNVVVSPAPVQTSYIVQNAGAPQEEGCCSGSSMKFNGTSGMATGIIQLIIAILSIVFGGASYAFPYSYYYPAYGIWAGLLFFLPAGILGTLTNNRSTCVVTAYLVMSILCTFQAFSMIIYEGVYAGVYTLINSCNSACGYYGSYDSYSCTSYCNTEGSEGAVAVHSILAILALIEFIVSIVASAICCGGLRCCCASPSTTATTTTTTSYAYGGNPNQGYVVQPAQPGQPGQPAPYENKM